MDLLRKGQTEAWPEVHPELLPFLRPRLSQSCHILLWFHSLAWLIVTPFSCPKFHTTSSFCASLQKYAQISDVILKTFQLCFYLHGQAAIIMRCPWDGTREGPFVITNLATNHVISSVNIEINNIEYNRGSTFHPPHDPLINIETRTFFKNDIIIACRPSISILPSMMWIIWNLRNISMCSEKQSVLLSCTLFYFMEMSWLSLRVWQITTFMISAAEEVHPCSFSRIRPRIKIIHFIVRFI